MFAFFQFPLAESRCFISQPTGRLKNQVWPIINPGEDFIRSFGIAQKRNRGGNCNWEGEEVYSKAARAIGFEPNLGKKSYGTTDHSFSPDLHFRRFFSDGKAISRVEIGFYLRRLQNLPVSVADIQKVISGLLGMTVHIPRNQKSKEYKFYNAGPHFASHYLRSTTRIIDGKLHNTENWWVSSGIPLILVELYQDDPIEPLRNSRKVDFADLEIGVDLSYIPYCYRNKPIALWILNRNRKSDFDVDIDYIRRLRLHIARLHSERECFKQVLKNILSGNIKIQRDTEASDNLQEYLNKATTLLKKEYRFGIPQTEILNQAMNMHELVNEGEATTLLGQLKSIRKNYFHKVACYINENPRLKTVFISYNHKDSTFVTELQEQLMSAGINVQIDSRNMTFSDDIDSFIDKSLRVSDFTVFVVSKNSLRSGWVANEIMGTMAFERVLKEKKMLPLYIDGSIFNRDFYIKSLEIINKQIDDLWKKTEKVRELDGGTQVFDAERARLENLKHNLPSILKKLQESLVADFSNQEKINTNLPRLIDLIKRN